MESTLQSKLSQFGDGIRTKIEDVSEALESNAHRIAEALDHRSRQINQTLIERTREIAETFTTGQTEFASLIDDRLIEVGGQLTSRIERLAETLSRARQLDHRLARRQERGRGADRPRGGHRGHPAARRRIERGDPRRARVGVGGLDRARPRHQRDRGHVRGARQRRHRSARTAHPRVQRRARRAQRRARLAPRRALQRPPQGARPARHRRRRDGLEPQRRSRPHPHRERPAGRRVVRHDQRQAQDRGQRDRRAARHLERPSQPAARHDLRQPRQDRDAARLALDRVQGRHRPRGRGDAAFLQRAWRPDRQPPRRVARDHRGRRQRREALRGAGDRR